MTDAILTLNAGSSSLKVALYPAAAGQDGPLATGLADRIGPEGTLALQDATGAALPVAAGGRDTHEAALRRVLDSLAAAFPGLRVAAVGHRVVHGGVTHDAPARVDAAMLERLDALCPFAPLHQPHNLSGIRAAMAAFPGTPQVACFDTAFHRGQPFESDSYALPRAYYDKGVRRYGFHGLSYQSVAGTLARRDAVPGAGRVVIAHLGNGASMCGLKAGRSVASTMGFTPLDGLPMGTRCGQLDPGVVLYLMASEGLSEPEISDLLYRRSGLLGLSGLSNDMRRLEASDDPRAAQAIACFTARIRQELGGLAAVLGGLDALVFCGGIGEHSARVRAEVCAPMGWMGVTVDAAANAHGAETISAPGAPVRVMVIPTDEERVIAEATRQAGLGIG